MLVVNYLHSFREVATSMSIHNFSNVKGTVVGKGMKTWKLGFTRGPGKTNLFGFPLPQLFI